MDCKEAFSRLHEILTAKIDLIVIPKINSKMYLQRCYQKTLRIGNEMKNAFVNKHCLLNQFKRLGTPEVRNKYRKQSIFVKKILAEKSERFTMIKWRKKIKNKDKEIKKVDCKEELFKTKKV